MLDSRRSMPAVLDRHIEIEEQDAFGHRHYAQALRCLIEDENHKPPFSIGLLGGWGTGKSSVKELYTRALNNDTSAAGGRQPRSQRFKSITFNAWRFGGKEQDIKRALLRHVFLELGGDEGKLHDELYRNVTHTESVTKSIGALTKQHLISWAAPVPAFAIAFITYLLFIAAGLKWLPLDNGLTQSFFIAAVSGIYAYLIKVMKPSAVSPFNTITRVHLPSVNAEQYEELLLQQLRKFKPTKGNAVPYERLVIFVDDLDRLSAEEMVLGLDAVRTFMEIPTDKLPENLGLVFVISCDEGKVADALSRRRGNPEQPGSIFNPTDARRYLDRIFQFRLEIPPPPRNDMRQFALSKLKAFPDLVKEIADKGASVEQVVDRMIHANVTDPRNALQIVNAFTQTWWLAKTRELDAIGSERPGGLHEGAVTQHPIALGALSAARVSFPAFYRDLQEDPQLLFRLTNLMVRQTLLKDEPLDSHHVLKRYVAEDSSGKTILVEGCRDLRQFLASLVGTPWPESLQSLLLLTEDSVTRQYGGQATRIYGYLVSGDTQGFLEALSPRANDYLSDQEVQLLHGMLSELHRTEEALKFNAMRVVADIIDRLPPRTRNLVLGILSNDIVTSPELRSLLGIEKIGRVTAVANSVDQQHIASVLIDELLSSGKVSTMRLPTGQTPNMDEAIGMAKGAVEIALSVLAAHGLPAQAKESLSKWLSERTVSAAAGSITLPFIELQQWVDRYEASLLPEIGDVYVDQLTTALHHFEEKASDDIEPLDTLDMPLTATRINTVWERLAGEGGESRERLWEQITHLSTMRAPEMAECVIQALERYISHTDDEHLLECLTRFSRRVAEFKEAPLDYKRAFSLVVNLGAERRAHFKREHYEAYADFAVALSEIADCEQDAADVFHTVVAPKKPAVSSVAKRWISHPLEQVPSVCRIALFEAYEHLPEEDRLTLADHLTALTTRTVLDDEDESLYTEAATHIPEQYWGESTLKAHLDGLLPILLTRIDSWDSYLAHVIPGFSLVFIHASQAVLGPSLQKLFSSSRTEKNTLESLHRYFKGRWPTVEQLPNGYAPNSLFMEASQVAVASPGFVGQHTLASMESMLTMGIVPADLHPQLIETACLVWQQRPAEAVEFLSSGNKEMSVTQIAALCEAIDFNTSLQVDMLEHTWKALIPELAISDRTEATKAVLLKGSLGNVNDPDLAFSVWSRALQGKAFHELKTLLLGNEINDEQRKRVLGHIVHVRQDEKESRELLQLAVQLLKLPESPLTWGAVNALRSELNKRLVTPEQRLAYAKLLLGELADAASDTAKGYMAGWAKTLGTEAVLKEVRPENFSEGDINIISTAFGPSRTLTGLIKRWTNHR
ncbi:KAP family P-loop NTPase fold protein [Pseudomonas sp. SDO55104_S430]